MYEKILSGLKTKYANLGLSEKVFEKIAKNISTYVTDEANVNTAIEGAEEMLKSIQSHSDSRVTVQKAENDKLKAENDKLKEVTPTKTNEELEVERKANEDKPEWALALEKTMGTVVSSLSVLAQEKQTSTKLEQAKEVMKASKLPEITKEKWLGRINLESEVPFDQQVKDLEEEYVEVYKVNLGDNTGSGLPLGGETTKEVSDAIADDIADDLV